MAPAVAAQWPTPAARDIKGANGAEHLEKSSGSLHLDQLPNFVEHLWRTPQAMDAERGTNGTWQPKPQAGQHSLRHQTDRWKTPRTERGDYTRDKGDPEAERLTMEGQAKSLASSLPDQPISTVGEESSHIRRSLNPLFVEWLMGWTRGWTSLVLTPPGSTASACSAMALSLFKRRSRSALLQLGLPLEAAPAQLGLFG